MAGDTTSGPGALSKRTDKGPAQKIRDLPDAQYGEAATYKDLQQQAPLAQTPQVQAPRKPRGGTSMGHPGVVPLSAPTTRPDEPVTAGAAAGPGPGPGSLGLGSPNITQWSTARDLLQGMAERQPDNSAIAYLAARLQGRY